MAPSAVNEQGVMTAGLNGRHSNGINGTKAHHLSPHDYVQFDPSLKPKSYGIKGTSPDSKVLFRDVNIIDSSGHAPFRGDVYIEGELRAGEGALTLTESQCYR